MKFTSRGGGGQKSVKKGHVLFEWLLIHNTIKKRQKTATNFLCVRITRIQKTVFYNS